MGATYYLENQIAESKSKTNTRLFEQNTWTQWPTRNIFI